jgi:Ca2+-binding RTX toxin-like protein
VRAIDGAGQADPTPASFTWTIDTAAPAVGNGNTESTPGTTGTDDSNAAPTATVAGGRCSAGTRARGTLNLKLLDTDGDTLGLTLASTSNAKLLPNRNVALGGSGSDRTLRVTGAAKRKGTAILTLDLSDGSVTVPVTVTVKSGSGKADVLNGTAGTDMIFGLGGGDALRGLGGTDLLCGGKKGDKLNGGDGNDVLRGSSGNDSLNGGGGNDSLNGGKGKDILRGASGNDSLTGGAGADRFSGGSGTDVATDFKAAKGDTRDRTIP